MTSRISRCSNSTLSTLLGLALLILTFNPASSVRAQPATPNAVDVQQTDVVKQLLWSEPEAEPWGSFQLWVRCGFRYLFDSCRMTMNCISSQR